MNKYTNNEEPKIGDRVKFESDSDGTVFIVKSVYGGRVGNKIGIVPAENQSTFVREYYYHCFVKID